MTVKEFISELKKYPSGMEIYQTSDRGTGTNPSVDVLNVFASAENNHADIVTIDWLEKIKGCKKALMIVCHD